MNVDDWNVEEVLADPEYGGFEEVDPKKSKLLKKVNKHNGELSNSRGLTCNKCGNIMKQTNPNCYSCFNCAEKVGGCGQ